jgi:hypothetical protein
MQNTTVRCVIYAISQLPHDEKDPIKENDPRKVEIAIEAAGTSING